jgi:hypothetical protein
MDRVRFGRALGFGARQAVKTLVTAVDAATSANPSGQANAGQLDRTPQARPATDSGRVSVKAASPPTRATTATPAARAAKTVVQARAAQKGLRRGTRRFGEAVWGPFVRLSGVLWLEVSGVFFGLVALWALGFGWKVRDAWSPTAANAANHHKFVAAVLMLALFGYFCVSSFVRARRRERRR